MHLYPSTRRQRVRPTHSLRLPDGGWARHRGRRPGPGQRGLISQWPGTTGRSCTRPPRRRLHQLHETRAGQGQSVLPRQLRRLAQVKDRYDPTTSSTSTEHPAASGPRDRTPALPGRRGRASPPAPAPAADVPSLRGFPRLTSCSAVSCCWCRSRSGCSPPQPGSHRRVRQECSIVTRQCQHERPVASPASASCRCARERESACTVSLPGGIQAPVMHDDIENSTTFGCSAARRFAGRRSARFTTGGAARSSFAPTPRCGAAMMIRSGRSDRADNSRTRSPRRC